MRKKRKKFLRLNFYLFFNFQNDKFYFLYNSIRKQDCLINMKKQKIVLVQGKTFILYLKKSVDKEFYLFFICLYWGQHVQVFQQNFGRLNFLCTPPLPPQKNFFLFFSSFFLNILRTVAVASYLSCTILEKTKCSTNFIFTTF